jgi:hypothetical protein
MVQTWWRGPMPCPSAAASALGDGSQKRTISREAVGWMGMLDALDDVIHVRFVPKDFVQHRLFQSVPVG